MRRRHVRNVQANKVRFLQDGFKIGVFEAKLLFQILPADDVVVDHAHGEALPAPRHFRSDAAQSNQAKRGVMNVLPHEQERPPGFPLAGMHELVTFAYAAGRGHEQREGKVSGRVG